MVKKLLAENMDLVPLLYNYIKGTEILPVFETLMNFGGEGSGNFDHDGRPGEVGGSGGGGGGGGGAKSEGKSTGKIEPPKSAVDLGRFISEAKSTEQYKETEQKIADLEKDTKSNNVMNWSVEHNTDANGNYTPERQELHDKIIKNILTEDTKAAEGTRPQAVLLLGAPGSGKTTAGMPVATEFVGKDTKLAVINADDIKTELGSQNWNVAAYHEESSQLAERTLIPNAVEGRHNVLFDATGANAAKMEAIAKGLSENGYDVHIVSVSVPTHVSVSRAYSRFEKGGRFVPLDYANKVDGKPAETFEKLKNSEHIKSAALVNNSGAKAVVVERIVR